MKLIKIASTIIIICAVVFLSIGCSSEATTTVKTQNYTVTKGSVSVSITGTGNLALSRTENLAFEMAGTVDQVLVEESETVKKGQELVTLDTSAWETQLKTLEKALVTAQRNLSTKEKALTTAERAVIAKETAVITAERQVTTKQLAVRQAELNVQSANNTLNDITEVKKAKDALDNATLNLKILMMLIAGNNFGGFYLSEDQSQQLTDQITPSRNYIKEMQEEYDALIAGTGVTTSTDVALLIAQKKYALDQAQSDYEDAQIAVDNAKSAVADAQLALEDARTSVKDAQLDVADAKTAVTDAQEDLDEAKALSPVITAPFDGFISSIKVEGGDDILKGTVALVIADPDQFSAKISVTEDDISSVKLGSDATVTVTPLSASFPAKVTKISPTATVTSGVVTFIVTVNITSLQPIITTTTAAPSQLPAASANMTPSGMPSGTPSGNFTMPAGIPQTTTSPTSVSTSTANVTLKDGLSATVEIVSQQKTNVVKILSKAITSKNKVSTVQVVTTGTATETRTITTGITDGTYTEIISGLTEGEVIQVKASSSSSSTTSDMTISAQMQIQSISGGGPGFSGGPPPGGGF
jgi:multidrug efflux pump subunit AcrA (membrane-fusion protein)